MSFRDVEDLLAGVLVTALQNVPLSKSLKLRGNWIFLLQEWLIDVRLRFLTFLASAHYPDTDLRYRQFSVKSYDSSMEKWRKCVLFRASKRASIVSPARLVSRCQSSRCACKLPMLRDFLALP